MTTIAMPLQTLTAGDVMSRDLKTLTDSTPLREAADQLVHWGVHGVPVVNEHGRCVGVFTVSDVVRWVSEMNAGRSPQPRTCSFQAVLRAPGGAESVRCVLPPEACPHQRIHDQDDGRVAVECSDPHSVPTDWQMVELETAPAVVRDVMTTMIVAVPPETSIAEVARTMLERRVQRVLVLDPENHPVGLVSVDDLLQCLAHADACVGAEA